MSSPTSSSTSSSTNPDRNLLAANVDVVVLVCGLDRPVKEGRINRVVTLAWDAGAIPAVVLAKADLHPDAATVAETVEAANPGVDVLVTSASGGEGLDAVADLVRGRTIVLVGESGAGKSTLTNALAGVELTGTGAVRRGDAKGRHTITARQLFVLPGGGVLIDTPRCPRRGPVDRYRRCRRRLRRGGRGGHPVPVHRLRP